MKQKLILFSICSVTSVNAFAILFAPFCIDHTFVSVGLAGSHVWSQDFSQSYAVSTSDGFIPTLNQANLNKNVGGLQIEMGYVSHFNMANLRASLQFLSLGSMYNQLTPFYNTNAFSSAFTTITNVNALTINAGALRPVSTVIGFYGDVGLGVAFLNTYSTYATSADALNVAETNKQNTTNLTWRLGGGSIIRLSKNWALNIGLHYENFGNLEFGNFAKSPALPNGVNYNADTVQAWILSVALELAA